MQMNDKPKRAVSVYCAGGGGTNIGQRLEHLRTSSDAGYAALDITYVDTSRSNISSDISSKSVFLVKSVGGGEKDGSGKVRSENSDDIHAAVPEILVQHKPGDLNIIISTLAGGTGSVAGPLLAAELTRRRLPTVYIAIGDVSTLMETRNTVKTLKSLESIAQNNDQPIAMFYLQNSATLTRAEIDRRVKSLVSLLCALFSGENRELDSADLLNWLYYPKVTSFRPQLTALTLVSGDEAREAAGLTDLGNVIAVATIAKDGDSTAFGRTPEYQCYGFFGPGFPERPAAEGPHHFVLSDGPVHDILGGLSGSLRTMEEQSSARQDRRRLLDGTEKAHSTGLIL